MEHYARHGLVCIRVYTGGHGCDLFVFVENTRLSARYNYVYLCLN